MDYPKCPRYGMVLRRPCTLTLCRNYVPYQRSLNCLPVHLAGRADDALGVQELALLERRQPEEIEHLLKIGQLQVQLHLARDDLDQRFSRVSECCPACGTYLDPTEEPADATYCSEECRQEFPLWRLGVEDRFGVAAEVAARDVVTRFGRDAAQQLLGVTAPQLLQLVPLPVRAPVPGLRRAGRPEAAPQAPVPILDRLRRRVFSRWGRSRLSVTRLLWGDE